MSTNWSSYQGNFIPFMFLLSFFCKLGFEVATVVLNESFRIFSPEQAGMISWAVQNLKDLCNSATLWH